MSQKNEGVSAKVFFSSLWKESEMGMFIFCAKVYVYVHINSHICKCNFFMPLLMMYNMLMTFDSES